MKKQICALLFIIVITGCKSNKDKNCTSQYSAGGRTYYIEGCFVDSLEDGHWKKMDSVNNVIEEGNYHHGILTGIWIYNPPHEKSITINWKKFKSDSLKFYSNIPVSFTRVEENPTFIKFNQRDTSEKLTVIVSVEDAKHLGFPIEKFYQQGENEIKEKGFKFKRKSYTINSDGQDYYMNEYAVDKGSSTVTVFNLYSIIPGNKIAIITVNFSPANDQFARIIFANIFANWFIEGRRFARPYNPQ